MNFYLGAKTKVGVGSALTEACWMPVGEHQG